MIGWLIVDASGDDGGNEVDVGFLQDMRLHHEQAVEMAFMYLSLPDTDPACGPSPGSILFGQSIDIGRMIQLLRDMGAPGGRRDRRGDGVDGHADDARADAGHGDARSSSTSSPRRAARPPTSCSST